MLILIHFLFIRYIQVREVYLMRIMVLVHCIHNGLSLHEKELKIHVFYFFVVGFDRLPPGANPLDPHWIEMQRRYASLAPGGLGGSHIPGVYPPASLASDLLARERERIERLGM